MNPLKTICFVACLLAGVCAYVPHQRQSSHHSNSLSDSLKPTEWLSVSELQSAPSVDQISLKELENMSNFEGATLINKLYHLSRINNEMKPEYKPSASDIPAYIMKPNGHNMSTTLDKLVEVAKNEPDFGDEEVTIFITGMPPKCRTITKTTDKLVRAYQKRYNGKFNDESSEESQQNKNSGGSSSSEESNQNKKSWSRKESKEVESTKRGDLVVIDLGATLKNFQRMFLLDVDNTGSMVGKVIAQLSKEADVPQEIIHIVAQGIAAHVAGVAGRQFTRLTGHKLRRITALDPSKIFVENPNTLTALSRGDADFVDAIHTSTYGLGSPARVGDVDFYPNGPSVAVPGSDNIVEATMKATRYYAESVVPGKERNFPADAAISMNDYKNRSGNSKRAYMGIDTDFDLEGDFMLQVNPHSPYGKSSAQFKDNSMRPNKQFNSWQSAGKGFKVM